MNDPSDEVLRVAPLRSVGGVERRGNETRGSQGAGVGGDDSSISTKLVATRSYFFVDATGTMMCA